MNKKTWFGKLIFVPAKYITKKSVKKDIIICTTFPFLAVFNYSIITICETSTML